MACQVVVKKFNEFKKSSKYNSDNVILYINDTLSDETIELMRQGYEEMSLINLELASMTENELNDVNEYETWLCGE
ncbi:MAG: hypothetical protein ACRDCB_07670 [Clostridium sp.]|uniref:hypothetical protein n=1 Tax=Clostridium TaxID=1485 RepID=UPI0018840D59|nr:MULTISPECIES: hypothetical protein [Clostridium]MCR6513913.1 hypothetical protein [Clostridium sp. LY3-2]